MVKSGNIVILSGYFNPVHKGHVRMINEANTIGATVVIVNNDKQQLLKKGKIIMDEEERLEIIANINSVGVAKLSIDKDSTVKKTLKELAKQFTDHNIIFANGGSDRKSIEEIPEYETCKKHDIKLLFGIGGWDKSNSSSKINKLRGEE